MREPGRADAGLEQALVELGTHLAYPPTPDAATAARRRLQTAQGRHRVGQGWAVNPRRLVLAAALLLALVGLALAASPTARRVIADRLGVRGIDIRQVPALPPIPPTPSPVPSATPRPFGEGLSLGTRVTLDEARQRVNFELRLPTLPELGQPDEIYFDATPPGGRVSLVYGPPPGWPASPTTGVALLITQFRGETNPLLMGKLLAAGTTLDEVQVNGWRGFWLAGEPHAFFFRDPQGEIHQETLRLAGNTLVWEQANVTLRIEGAPAREQALRLATSMR